MKLSLEEERFVSTLIMQEDLELIWSLLSVERNPIQRYYKIIGWRR